MYVDFIRDKGKVVVNGPFDNVYIEGVTLHADNKEIAHFNRDESFWSEDFTHKTIIHKLVIRN